MGTCNKIRSDRASAALQAHKLALGESGISPEEDIIDLLTDLRHYCHQKKINFAAALEMSEYIFGEEKED